MLSSCCNYCNGSFSSRHTAGQVGDEKNFRKYAAVGVLGKYRLATAHTKVTKTLQLFEILRNLTLALFVPYIKICR